MADLVTAPVCVSVPASSANLGPGFDTLALALDLRDELTAQLAAPGTVDIVVEGEGADTVPRDRTHLVHRSLCRGFEAMGVPVPGISLRCRNVIPHGRGLGSSSAAIVGGLALARALVRDGGELLDDDALFQVAAEIEGHPDNVAPALFGGFTIAYEEDSRYGVVRLDVTSALRFVVFVPPTPLETTVARGLLPAVVPHGDAARNAGRAALLVAALTGRAEVLLAATEDRLHQDYRAPAMPESARLVRGLRERGLPAVISGAGPTVLAMVPEDAGADVQRFAPPGWRAMSLRVEAAGVQVC